MERENVTLGVGDRERWLVLVVETHGEGLGRGVSEADPLELPDPEGELAGERDVEGEEV